jgi:hypothetical protein
MLNARKAPKKRAANYDIKLAINGTFENVIRYPCRESCVCTKAN